jgi:hypothetical protein
MPPEGAFFVVRGYRWMHNFGSLATALGITTNIIDCYAAILSMWEPGDRIFVFGFREVVPCTSPALLAASWGAVKNEAAGWRGVLGRFPTNGKVTKQAAPGFSGFIKPLSSPDAGSADHPRASPGAQQLLTAWCRWQG